MAGYALRPRARRDIDDIWSFTMERWGEAQAERYVSAIRSTLDRVAGDPSKGRPCDDVRAGYFKIASGSHLIFYRFHGQRVEVVRVLHQRMDVRRHL